MNKTPQIMTEDKIQSVLFTAQNNELKCDDY